MAEYNILLIGSGAREHAIAWKLLQSAKLNHLYCTDENIGFHQHPKITIIKQVPNNIDLIIIGPETPIFEGLADKFRQNGFNVLAPSKIDSQLESSKHYAKNFMQQHNIPTPDYKVFKDISSASAYCQQALEKHKKLVLKADGPALGKGVAIVDNIAEAQNQLELLFKNYGPKILIEEFLQGEELSYFVLSDGSSYQTLGYARDYKTILDDNKGPNSGGMGAYSSLDMISQTQHLAIKQNIVCPTLMGLKNYIGILFFGLILTKKGPYLLEYNIRLGDPEAQTILPLLENDLVELFLSAATGRLDTQTIKLSSEKSISLVLANKGYPGPSTQNLPLELGELQQQDHINIFYANLQKTKAKHIYKTKGGRLLTINSLGKTKEDAIKKAYKAIKTIKFTNGFYRTDIGK